jgi:LysR family transcriptional regulator, regulator for metE and metH
MPMLELKDLRLVQAVAECGSVTRAAQKVHITQSGLSHQLADLEDRVGCPLFFRLHGKMLPTPAGERLLREAPAMLERMKSLECEVQQIVGGGRGKLRVSSECYTCYGWIPRVLPAFRKKFPGVDFEIVAEATWHSLEALLDGRVDISFSYLPPRDRRLASQPLFRDEVLGVVSPHHALAGKKFLRPEDFEEQTMLLHGALESSYVYDSVLKPAGIVPAGSIAIGLTEAVLETAAAGLGIGCIAEWAARDWLRAGKLVGIPITQQGVYRDWQAVSLKARKRPAHEEYFIHLLAKRACANGC